MVTLERVEADLAAGQGTPNDWLRSVDAAFPDLSILRLTAAQALQLRQGRVLAPMPELAVEATMRAYDAANSFLGLVEVGPDHCVRVRRLFVTGAA
jgi:hypothetical protein